MDVFIPSTLQPFLFSFSWMFTVPSQANFVVLLSGWLLNRSRHTISRALRTAGSKGLSRHHSVFYNFFSRAQWYPKHLGRTLFDLALPWIPGDTVFLIIDDTLCRRSGPHVFGGGMHHDPLVSTYCRGAARRFSMAFGHNWVTAAVWAPLPWNTARGMAIPVGFQLYRSKKTAPATLYRKRTDLAADLLRMVSGWLPAGKRLHVVGDTEYANQSVVKSLPETTHFTGPMRMDAKIHAPLGSGAPKKNKKGRPRAKGERLPAPSKIAEDARAPWRKIRVTIYGRTVAVWVKTSTVLWYHVAGKRPLRLVITRDPKGRIEDRAYFCTDASRTPARILADFARRWSLEVTFYNTKQFLGLEEPQNGWSRRKRRAKRKKPGPQPRGNRGKRAVERTVPFIFAAYSTVVFWYFKHGDVETDVQRAKKRAPWYRQKREPAFGDMLLALRREILRAQFLNDPYFGRIEQKREPPMIKRVAEWIAWAA